MNIREIEPKFEEIEERLSLLESTQHAHETDAEPLPEISESTAGSAFLEQLSRVGPPELDTEDITSADAEPLPEGVPADSPPELDTDAEVESGTDDQTSEDIASADAEPLPEETEEEVGVDPRRFQNETASAATSHPVDTLDSDLKARIASDVKPYKVAEVINAAMNHPKLRHARELVMKPETGVMEKVQSFRLTDGTFMVPSREVFERVVLETKIDEVEWVKDVADCEDISLRFNARCIELGLNSCGRVMSWSGGHCFIIAIVRDGDSLGFAFLEPQTDEFLTDALGEGQYSLDNCLILIN